MTTTSKLDNFYIEPEVEEYINFLNESDSSGKLVVTPDRVMRNFENYGNAMNTLLAYPDLVADIATPKGNAFNLYFYQRLFIRSMSRYRQTFITATRGASKTFLGMFSRYIMSMMVPGHKSFVAAPGKQQTANLAREKINEDIWEKFPLLKNEMMKIPQPGKPPKQPFTLSKDSAKYEFTGGGILDIVGTGATVRGGRRHSGSIEEVLDHDPIALNERVIPLMNISRRSRTGDFVEEEPHAQKIYVTTASAQGTFAYSKMIESMLFTVLDPTKYNILAMSYKIPMMHGLLEEQTIREILAQPTFDKDSFNREYMSIYTGDPRGAAFNYNLMRNIRKVNRAEFKNHAQDEEFYVISADMAKDGDAATSVVVFKVIPQQYNFLYKQVNALTIDNSNYEVVANRLKEMVILYDARLLVYDANGIGAAIRDWLNKDTITENGQLLPGYGIINPPKESEKDIRRHTRDRRICYEIKASSSLSTKINRLFFGRVNSNAVKLLISSTQALHKMKKHKKFLSLPMERQRARLVPYQHTDILQEEFLNLDVADTTDNLQNGFRVVRRNKKIQKDFYSAASYGIYAAHNYLEVPYYNARAKRRKQGAKYVFYSSGK